MIGEDIIVGYTHTERKIVPLRHEPPLQIHYTIGPSDAQPSLIMIGQIAYLINHHYMANTKLAPQKTVTGM